MEPMDQFFRKKIEERQYEYHESYWEEAERMISQRDGRRRRAFWWWAFGLGLLLISIVAVGWWFLATGNSDKTTIGSDPSSEPARPKGTPRALFELLPGEPSEGQTGLNGREGVIPTLEPTISNGTGPGKGAGQTVSTEQKDGSLLKAGGPDVDKIFKNETSIGKPGLKGPVGNIKEQAALPIRQHTDSTVPAVNPSVMLEKGEKMTVERMKSLLGPVDERLMTLGRSPDVREYPIRTRRRLNWEAALAATVNPSGGKSLLGGTAGLRASRQVKESTWLTAGIQYRLRGGSFGPSQGSRQVTYGFGREEQKYDLRPNRLHYAEALFQAEWPVKRHNFALGLGWNYLLGIEGSLSSTVKEEFALSFGAGSSQEKGWLDEKGYKKQFGVARAAYHYQLLGRLKIGMELQYTPGGILEKSVEGEPDVPLLKESTPLIIDVGIKYSL